MATGAETCLGELTKQDWEVGAGMYICRSYYELVCRRGGGSVIGWRLWRCGSSVRRFVGANFQSNRPMPSFWSLLHIPI